MNANKKKCIIINTGVEITEPAKCQSTRVQLSKQWVNHNGEKKVNCINLSVVIKIKLNKIKNKQTHQHKQQAFINNLDNDISVECDCK